MTRTSIMALWFAWSALGASACRTSTANTDHKDGSATDSAGSGDDYRPSVYEWLPGTTWDCDWVYTRTEVEYRVAHTWQFGQDRFSADVGERIRDAFLSGDVDTNVCFNSTWLDGDCEVVKAALDNRWYGIGANVILAEFGPPSSGNTFGYEHVFHRDGDEHMAIQTPIDSYTVSAISCTLATAIARR